MIIEKKIMIHGKEFNLFYKTYSNSILARASLKILYGKVHIASLYIVRHRMILVNGKQKMFRCTTLSDAKIAMLKLLTNS